MLRKCAYFEQKLTQTEKSNLSECSFSCFHGCESLAEIDPRKVVEVVRLTRHKNNASATHFFALSPKPIAQFRWKRARLSLFRPQPHLPSFIQIDSSFRELLAKTSNDLLDRYNNRRCRSEIGSPIIS